ncbi:MAG: ABC transporter ATP-binding protein [Patescibacteria group bacterium]
MFRIQDLCARSIKEVLSGISLEVKNGQVLAILGKSDSGKHLLGEILAGKCPAISGEIITNNYRRHTHRQKTQIQTGYLANPVQLEEFLTGFELLDLIGSLYHLSPVARTQRIAVLANTLEIGQALYSVIESTDPATRQKIALAIALIHSPKVLILDEPAQYLDFVGQKQVERLITDQTNEGSSVVLITDNLELAERLADEIIILDQGQILLAGTLQRLINQTKSRAHSLDGVMKTIFGYA